MLDFGLDDVGAAVGILAGVAGVATTVYAVTRDRGSSRPSAPPPPPPIAAPAPPPAPPAKGTGFPWKAVLGFTAVAAAGGGVYLYARSRK